MPAGTRDPWPSPHPAWHDPPWLLGGRVVTAWFMAPWEVVEHSLSPDLLPERASEIRTRLRFYELEFEALGRHPGQPLAPTTGRFKEAVVGFPARAGELEGEASIFMWSDTPTYVMWAREAFGYPVLLADITLDGPVWTTDEILGSTGGAGVETPHGSAALRDATVSDRSSVPLTAPCWLTPRRQLTGPPGIIDEQRDLLAVWPTVRKQGDRFSGEGRVVFDFAEEHPLGPLGEHDAELDILDGFELVVAERIEIL